MMNILKCIGTMATPKKKLNVRIIIIGFISIFIIALIFFINRDTDWWSHPDLSEEISIITIYPTTYWFDDSVPPLARITNDPEIKYITKIIGKAKMYNSIFIKNNPPDYILELVEKDERCIVIGVDKTLIQVVQGGSYKVDEELYKLLSVYENKSEEKIDIEDNQ